MIDLAKSFAENAHQGQLRKISGASYFTHLENVAFILGNAGFSNEVIAAGYLHDIIEDTNVTETQLLGLFGHEIVQLVIANSEDKSLEWEVRKGKTIVKTKTASIQIKALIAADKLDNSHDLLQQYQKHGDKVWSYFNRGYEKQAWYYHHLVDALYDGLTDTEIPSFFHDLRWNVEELFGG
ncbi:HD domain-containing protein [Metabacillus rhizolycopersici]|uniref:HD domain-containing protein n=1 Tax=Metabacillus rhizolycopersici TaxID=2875709 RepID=A0ABS7ULM1_9BACI|nr:HD domain-containing protein [Metabacillus rhizolycopersici]MBZ5748848.1 HD domain-containing protein [Metabacillus rhizolycopersici]